MSLPPPPATRKEGPHEQQSLHDQQNLHGTDASTFSHMRTRSDTIPLPRHQAPIFDQSPHSPSSPSEPPDALDSKWRLATKRSGSRSRSPLRRESDKGRSVSKTRV